MKPAHRALAAVAFGCAFGLASGAPARADPPDNAALTLGDRLGVPLTPIDVALEAPAEMSAVQEIVAKRLAKLSGPNWCRVIRMESRLIRVECSRSTSRDFIDYVCDWNATGAHLTPVHGMTAPSGTKWGSISTGAAKSSHYLLSRALTG